mgnify:CR=1 FL=1
MKNFHLSWLPQEPKIQPRADYQKPEHWAKPRPQKERTRICEQ